MPYRKQLNKVDNLTSLDLTLSLDNVFYAEETDKLKYYREPYVRLWTNGNSGYINCYQYEIFPVPQLRIDNSPVTRNSNFDIGDFQYYVGQYNSPLPTDEEAEVMLESQQSSIEYFFQEYPSENYYPIQVIDGYQGGLMYIKNGLYYYGCVVYYVTRDDRSHVQHVAFIVNEDSSVYNNDPVITMVYDSLSALSYLSSLDKDADGYVWFRMVEITNTDYVLTDNATTLGLEEGTKFIYGEAFKPYSSNAITKVVYSNGVETIDGYQTFKYCTNLTSVKLGNFVSYIGDDAFNSCTSLTGITLPDSVTHLGSRAFQGCSSLQELKLSNSLTCVSSYTFQNCTSLTSVDFGKSIEKIDDYAFNNCPSLSSIELPDSLVSLGRMSFSGCTGLSSVKLPDHLTYLGQEAFCGCISLTSIEIPGSVTNVEKWGFVGCTSLSNVKICEGVTSLNVYLFQDTNINHVELPSTLQVFNNGLFYHAHLTTLDIPASITHLGEYSLCYNDFTNFVIPETVQSLGSACFGYCSGLTSITLSTNITTLPANTFTGCLSLSTMVIPNHIQALGLRCFEGCSGLTSVTVPGSITNIPQYCFNQCTNLTELILSDGIKSLDSWIAPYSALSTITIPDSVTSINQYAFQNCNNLSTIYYSGTATGSPWGASNATVLPNPN